MSSWLRSIFYFTETEISSKNDEQVQYRVNRLFQESSFFQVCLQFQFFLHPKAFKIQTHRGESGFSRVLLWRAVTTRLLRGHQQQQQQQQQLYLYPTVYKNIGEYYSLPQITMGAKEKWQPYLGDLCIHVIIWVRYHTRTTQNTHACACALNTKTNKIKKVEDVKVKKPTKSQINYGVKILYNF